MEQVRFRQASRSDVVDVLTIKRAAIEAVDTDGYTQRQLDAWKPDTDALPAFERAIESDRFTIVLAELEGEPAGYGVLNHETNRIDALFVHPDFEGTGIGSSLLGQLEMRAQMHDIPELKVVASLNATSFYRSRGYWPFGTETRTIAGVDVEFTILRKTLDFDWSQ